MNLLKISRKYHRWLMLFVGVQFVIWSVSGAYMVIFDIDYIHGDSLVENHQTKLNPDKIDYPLAELVQAYPDAERLEMGVFLGKTVYSFKQGEQDFLIDAHTGLLLSPLDQTTAVKAAKHYYTGDGEVAEVELITQDPPFELSRRVLPAWRVSFDDFGSPSIYVSAETGKLVTKRHEFWRTFDLMFSLHVMDYEDEDPSNWLLFWFLLFSLTASILGLILTYFRVFKSSEDEEDSVAPNDGNNLHKSSNKGSHGQSDKSKTSLNQEVS
ncbi:PepSY domain-containing protein [Shewanella psychropiezotolerans]|uniref:PepSY domain-containing protein n=1 Tax=Shewanella psychropiezotolerans TaxID=2593655 RepID=UPI001E33E6DD|nr:PepSY domain-containing protein [Shewanella psychropiezotolerans]